MRTVKRRSCSAISPNPRTAMLLASSHAFPYDDAGFLQGATTDKLGYKRLAYGFGGELRVEILNSGDRAAAEEHENIADHNARFVCGTIRFHFEHNCGGCLRALQSLTECL